MSPAQLVRSLGTAARLSGLADRQAELVAMEERVTLDDVIDLLEEVSQAVDATRPPEERALAPRETGRLGKRRAARVLALAATGRRDPEIARAMGESVATVRGIRRRAGVVGAPPKPAPGWEAVTDAAIARGIPPRELARETGWTPRTAQQRMWLRRKALKSESSGAGGE